MGEEAGEHLGGFVEETGGQLAGAQSDDHRGRGDLDDNHGDLGEGCHFEKANFLEHGDHHHQYLKSSVSESNLWPINQDCSAVWMVRTVSKNRYMMTTKMIKLAIISKDIEGELGGQLGDAIGGQGGELLSSESLRLI